jgi:hypothetical protein
VSSDNLPAVRYTVGDIAEMAKGVAKSRLFGLDDSQAFTLMLLAHAKGLHPIQAVERYHVFQGKPAMKADAMLAEFQAHGGVVEWLQHDAAKCEARFHAPNVKTPTTVAWTMAEAKTAGLAGKDIWQKYPRQMLRARVISEGIRMTMPGILSGIYTPEEVADMVPIQATASVARDIEEADPDPANGTPGTATTKEIRRFETKLNDYCKKINAAWIDKRTTPDGEVPGWVKDLVNPYQLVGHMLKEARVEADGNWRTRMKAAARLWLDDEPGTVAGWRAYARRLSEEALAEHADDWDDRPGADEAAEGMAQAEPAEVGAREAGCDDE